MRKGVIGGAHGTLILCPTRDINVLGCDDNYYFLERLIPVNHPHQTICHKRSVFSYIPCEAALVKKMNRVT
jgi:hypothetical protein